MAEREKSLESHFSRRNFINLTCSAAAGITVAAFAAAHPNSPAPKPRRGQRRVFGLRFPPLREVRVGFIGVGGRGMSLLGNLLDIEHVQIKAVCDIVPERVAAAQKRVLAKGQPEPAAYAKSETDFEALCRRDDLDIIYIATPWNWHVPMAVSAMRQGKHAALEVPAAITLAECWELVDVTEQTQRHCIMLENCCYGEIELLVLRMVHQGLLGELTHGEAGYLHEARDYLLQNSSSATWRRQFVSKLNGNLYPTHGLGPVALYMDIHAGDRFDHLVSMSSLEAGLSRRRDTLPSESPARRERFACGDISSSLIQTALGRTILVQFSLVQSRPYSRINLIAGIKGTFCDYPPRLHLDGEAAEWITALQPYHEKYGHPLWKQLKIQVQQAGGHGGMDYIMNVRLIHCLREGLPLDLTVYDAAAWSSIFPLSIASVAKGSVPVAIPDFTRGAWKNQPPGALSIA